MLLYAETHYPRRMPSLTRRAEPEIVVDLPWRIEPEAALPVLLIVKDAHLYPVRIESLTFAVTHVESGVGSDTVVPVENIPIHQEVVTPWWWQLYKISSPLVPGQYHVTPTVHYSLQRRNDRHRRRTAVSDNYRGTSHRPFSVRVAAERWPVPLGWWAGDAHIHTAYTRDQVEFGPPVAAVATMSRAMGLTWAALTDHSYDLDDSDDSYLVNDSALPRWNALLCDAKDDQSGVCLIVGEEVSCGNSDGKNVHLLGLGMSEYIPGAGDSAERPLHTKPDLSVTQVARRIHQQRGIAIAAHPSHVGPWAERLIFRRGAWRDTDLVGADDSDGTLDGTQFWNGARDRGFDRGLAQWVNLLLRGKRIAAVAGSDSHGSFGRFRQVRLPWLWLTDDCRHMFAGVRTVIRAPTATQPAILEALAAGHSYLTDGPELLLHVLADGRRYEIGLTVPARRSEPCRAALQARSTAEWGALARVGIGVGIAGQRAESWRWRQVGKASYNEEWEIDLPSQRPAYVRAETFTRSGASALTNPIWLT